MGIATVILSVPALDEQAIFSLMKFAIYLLSFSR